MALLIARGKKSWRNSVAGNPKDHPFTPTSDTNTQCKWCSFQEGAHNSADYPPVKAVTASLKVPPTVAFEDIPRQRVNVTIMDKNQKKVIVGWAEVQVVDGRVLTSRITIDPKYEWLMEAVQTVPVQHSIIKKEETKNG